MTNELIAQNRRINLYLNGDITITSPHRRRGQNSKTNSEFSSHARKGYRIKKSTRRNIVSSAFLLFIKKRSEIVFLTLTFPKKVHKSVKINPLLNKFITNMRKTYGLGSFIWTREDQKSGRPHYHMLAEMPFQPIQKINTAWCSAINMYSSNAVRLPKRKGIVKDIDQTCRYISKYITKDEDKYYNERCYSVSREIKAEPIRISEYDLRYIDIDHGKSLNYRYYEHCTTVKIWDFFKKSDYFIEFLDIDADNPDTCRTQGGRSFAIDCLEPERKEAKKASIVQLPLDFR